MTWYTDVTQYKDHLTIPVADISPPVFGLACLLPLLTFYLCAVQGAAIPNQEAIDSLTDRAENEIPFFIKSEHDFARLPSTVKLQRNADNNPNRRWPNNTVPYIISNAFTSNHKTIIERSHREIENGTCIRFKSRTIERDYIEYVNNAGCNSFVGRIGGRQEVSLNIPACVTVGVVVHESLHAMGFNHEQCRSDRDQYIKVNLDNIQPEYRFAYDKLNTNNLKTPYDYKSIMHYGSTFFAIDLKKPTMVSLTPGVTIGRSDSSRMSPIDKQRINFLYQCFG
ncbi:putative High choriolytic enzyme 1 [Hypsibius exemplaris]|uniref:Metalloendopeptidase n=1 Tax=Hypsibius exemplaris TaxID=2072580 RepID=A0A1W0WXW3_HYPEX|nr:putative High choriolytic enzyme 1 [Hypsibius exemplaris]